jgi:calcineurin-like phosphoesterase family protein
MKPFFTSDTHFGHSRVIELCKRPFDDTTAMDEAMIRAWNDRVAPDDIVWHVGDFDMGRDDKIEATFHRLNGVKHLVLGNHDEEREEIRRRLKTLPADPYLKDDYFAGQPKTEKP